MNLEIKTQRETPDFVIEKLISQASLTDNIRLLEPSCGEGKIVKYIFNKYSFKGIKLTLVELNKEKFQITSELCEKIYYGFDTPEVNVYNNDFISWKNELTFDRIIACPPFKNQVDLEHIQKMYSVLKNKGTMVSLTKPMWVLDNSQQSIYFREWLEDKEYYFEMLPDNTFIEKYKNVPTAILKIIKR